MATETIKTYCSLCGVGCPASVTVDGDRVVSLAADRAHPRGGLMCAKGRAAPELHEHPNRVDHPLRRTRPKTDPDPGWQRCSWDEALDLVATTLSRVRTESGPQSVVIGRGTGGGTGLGPAEPWVKRLADAFGSPNYMTNTHLCNWARDGASYYTYGTYPLPPPDLERSNCVLVWGANPQATRIDLAASITAATTRGARLVVVDPRRTGLAGRADVLLQVRPGTDGALALAFVHLLLEHGWYDDDFVRRWTNAPHLVREDTGRLLRSGDVAPGRVTPVGEGAASGYVALDARTGGLVEDHPALRRYAAPAESLALSGSCVVELVDGSRVRCRPVLELVRDEARHCPPATAAQITGVPEEQIHRAVRLIVESRPLAHHAWNGIVQHTNGTQAGRAIELFYTLVGDWDRPGGNVVPEPAATARISGGEALPDDVAALRLGRNDRPLGPPSVTPENTAAYDLFTSVLDGEPYLVRALLSFGGNLMLNSGDPVRGREALRRLEFFAQVELFHTPTSQFADVLLPAASFLESDVLMVTGGRAERRRRVVAPRHERRPDVEVIFDLATRLGLGERFAGGDVAAAFDSVLDPVGLTWDGLLDHPEGVQVTPPHRYEKHAEPTSEGAPRGFPTPSGRVELFVDRFAAHGLPPVPRYEEPRESPTRTPTLARAYPLVMTSGKLPRYLHSQHRGLASLRRRSPDPTVEVHPRTAERFGVADGTWVMVETPRARVRVKARVTDAIVPGVVCMTHGWWEGCEELGIPALDPFGEGGANVNLLVHNDVRDPISGATPQRSSLCRLRPLGRTPGRSDTRSS